MNRKFHSLPFSILILSSSVCHTSCSTLKKSMASGAFLGSVAGGVGGAVFSPDDYSRDKNAYLGTLIGGAIGAGLGWWFYKEPKSTGPLSPIIRPQQLSKKEEGDISLFGEELKDIKPQVTFKPVKKYEVPEEALPEELKGKVKKQFIIEYQTQGQSIELENRQIEIGPFKAWEHVYEK
jgi:hypothetical protein